MVISVMQKNTAEKDVSEAVCNFKYCEQGRAHQKVIFEQRFEGITGASYTDIRSNSILAEGTESAKVLR